MNKNVNLKIISIITVIIFSFSFSIIPAYTVTDKVIIGGEAFGLKLYCKGVMVTGMEAFDSNGKKVCPAKECGIRNGDIITKINGKDVKSNEKISEIIKHSKGKELKLDIDRNNKEIKITLIPKKNNNFYCAGMWVRDSCAGIGTISYYDPKAKTYGALGHGICDSNTGNIMASDKGEIALANITGVNKSQNNSIGTLNGYFTEQEIGTINYNSPIGLYGKINDNFKKNTEIEILNNSQVKKGKVKIYSTVFEEKPKAYDAEITEICNTDKSSNKNFVIKITDNRLIEKTGGIVQGMSGSPIVQDGKLAGALTHVFLENCTMGYGILAENMIGNY